MPRKNDLSILEIRKARVINLQVHLDYKAYAKASNITIISRAKLALETIEPPRLNMCGLTEWKYFKDNFTNLMQIAFYLGLEITSLCWWYWSDPGWIDFETQWDDLPELYTGPVYKP